MYPNPNVDPKTKGREWLLQYAEQAWKDAKEMSPNIFYNAADKYDILKKYALGKQDTTKYMKPYVDDKGETFAVGLDYTIRPIISKYRDILISKLQQRDYNIVATPVDALAKSEADKYFNEAKAKIMMRDMLKQINPELIENPSVKHQPGEPEDMEELDMQKDYTWKHNMAMEAEMVWSLISDMNDFPQERNEAIVDWVDFGVTGYKDWNDSANNTRIRKVNAQNIISSYCRESDFSDACHIGEVIEESVNYLKTIFSKEELDKIVNTNQNEFAYRPTANKANSDKSKVQVLDLELITTDDIVFSQRENGYGNVVYGREEYKDYSPKKKTVIKGKEQPKYSSKKFENVYKVKWVIGTKFIYDFGVATSQKRDQSSPSRAALSYHLCAYNFYNMTAVGIMERLVPTLDEYQETVIKIRNFKNKWIPYLIDIDMDALENVALGEGGKNMTPMQLIDMAFQTHVILSRKRDISSQNINYKSVDVIPTPMAQEFAVLLQDLTRLLQELSDLSGFNQLTDGSTPNPKTLVPVANSAIDATNNSQYPLIRADKNLNQRLAKGVIQRVQMAIKSGKTVEGIVRSLGETTVKFFRASETLPMHEFGIQVEDRPTQEERAFLIQELNLKNQQGQLDPEAFVMIMDAPNLKQARMMLAYYTKKRRQKDQENAMMLQQQNGQIQIQSAQAAEQAKQQTIQVQLQADMQTIQLEKEWDFKIAQLKAKQAAEALQSSAGIKLTDNMLQRSHDERKEKIAQGIPVPEESPIADQIPQQQPQEMPV